MLKQTLLLFKTSASPDHLLELKKFATIIETAALPRPVPNTIFFPQQASVQLAPTHAPQTPTKQVTTYSTPVTPSPEPPANADITAPMTISYNES